MKIPDTEELLRIYQALADETSKKVYRHTILHSILGNQEEIEMLAYEYLLNVKQLKPSKICLYGAGVGGRWYARQQSLRPAFVVDKYKTGMLDDLPIIPLKDFLELPDCKEYLVVITVGKKDMRREIVEELESNGLRYLFGYYDEAQYFEMKSWCETGLHNEYFVDAGALNGGTTEYFLNHFENGHAYVFEPNPKDFETVKERLRAYPQAELFPYGVYDKNATLAFDPAENNRGMAKISETGSVEIEARRLDDLLGERKVTFLKMDIEGSELAALRGAERIIREQRPKLAICVYHKPEDIWEIPSLVLRFHPDYRLYLRHYSLIYTETVLYAV